MKHVFVLTCFLFVLFIDNSQEADAKCWYDPNLLQCGKLVDGSSKQCMCKTNCAPVSITCRKYGTITDWDFNSSPCFAQAFYNQVVPERNDQSLLMSYVAENYTLACKKGYKMLETVEPIQVSCRSGYLTIKPPTLQCDRVTCPSNPPETLRCLERESLNETTNNETYYGEKRECTCRNNCRNVTITCGEKGEWEYDTALCSDETTVQAYPDQHYVLWYLNGNYTVTCEPGYTLRTTDSPQCFDGELQYQQQVCEEELAAERHTKLLLSTSEIVLILVLCLVSLALFCMLVVTYRNKQDSESFVLYTKSQPTSRRSNKIPEPAGPTTERKSNLNTECKSTLKTDHRSNLNSKADSKSFSKTDSKKTLITDPGVILTTNSLQDCMIDNDLYISNEFTPKDLLQEDYYSNISEVLYENHDTLRQN